MCSLVAFIKAGYMSQVGGRRRQCAVIFRYSLSAVLRSDAVLLPPRSIPYDPETGPWSLPWNERRRLRSGGSRTPRIAGNQTIRQVSSPSFTTPFTVFIYSYGCFGRMTAELLNCNIIYCFQEQTAVWPARPFPGSSGRSFACRPVSRTLAPGGQKAYNNGIVSERCL